MLTDLKLTKLLNSFFLSQLNAHYMLKTYIYHLLPPICFGVCYTIFSETTALHAFCFKITQLLLYNVHKHVKTTQFEV